MLAGAVATSQRLTWPSPGSPLSELDESLLAGWQVSTHTAPLRCDDRSVDRQVRRHICGPRFHRRIGTDLIAAGTLTGALDFCWLCSNCRALL